MVVVTSTFTGKAVASGLADLYESLTAAMAGLAGPRHGKANQECLKFVQERVDAVGGVLSEEEVDRLIRHRLENKQLIFGFGHAVLRVEDPRATVFCDLGENLCPDDENFKMVQLLVRSREDFGETQELTHIQTLTLAAVACSTPVVYRPRLLHRPVRHESLRRYCDPIIYERCEARGGRVPPSFVRSISMMKSVVAKADAVRSATTGD